MSRSPGSSNMVYIQRNSSLNTGHSPVDSLNAQFAYDLVPGHSPLVACLDVFTHHETTEIASMNLRSVWQSCHSPRSTHDGLSSCNLTRVLMCPDVHHRKKNHPTHNSVPARKEHPGRRGRSANHARTCAIPVLHEPDVCSGLILCKHLALFVSAPACPDEAAAGYPPLQ